MNQFVNIDYPFDNKLQQRVNSFFSLMIQDSINFIEKSIHFVTLQLHRILFTRK